MATPKTWAVREVALATFYDIATGKALFHLQNLKTSGIENSAETVYARGGRGNAKIVGFSSNREARISLEDATFTNDALAMMTGNNLITSSKEIYRRDVLIVSNDSATLTKTPVGDLIGLYELNSDGSNGTELTLDDDATLTTGEYQITDKNITLFSGDYPDGTKLVAYYKVATDASSETITISSDKFAGSFKLVLDCLIRDAVTKQDYAAQIIVHNCKMEDNWSITMAAEGDPSVFTMPIEVLKPADGTEMYTITIYDDSLIN